MKVNLSLGEDKYTFVVEEDKNLIGFITFELSTKNEPELTEPVPAIYISGLYIQEKYRSKGLGKELMKIPEEMAKEKGIKYLKLVLFSNSEKTRAFYFKSGFEDYETTMIKKL